MEDIEVMIEGAEEDEEGLTNDVYFQDDKVIQIFSKYPLTSFFTSLTSMFSSPEYYSRSKRISNEVEAAVRLSDCEFKPPQVLDYNDEVVVFDRVEGKSGFDWFQAADEEEVRELANRFQCFFEQIHGMNVALRDARLSNFLISKDEVYSIDHEYIELNANSLIKTIDELTLISSVIQTRKYSIFIDEFDCRPTIRFLSFFTSIGHAILLERSMKRTKNVLRSLR